MEDRCQECVALLHAAQEEVRGLRKKHKPTVIRQNYTTLSPYLPEGSLAMELEDSLRRDTPEYNSPQEQRRCVQHGWSSSWVVNSGCMRSGLYRGWSSSWVVYSGCMLSGLHLGWSVLGAKVVDEPIV